MKAHIFTFFTLSIQFNLYHIFKYQIINEMSFIRCDVVVVSCSSQFIITFNQYKTIFNMEIATLHLFFYVDPIFKIHIHKMLYYLLANKMRSYNHEKMHGGRIVILLCHLEFYLYSCLYLSKDHAIRE